MKQKAKTKTQVLASVEKGLYNKTFGLGLLHIISGTPQLQMTSPPAPRIISTVFMETYLKVFIIQFVLI